MLAPNPTCGDDTGMKLQSLGLGSSSKRTRKREFLGEIERVVPWGDLVALIAPYMPEGRPGRGGWGAMDCFTAVGYTGAGSAHRRVSNRAKSRH